MFGWTAYNFGELLSLRIARKSSCNGCPYRLRGVGLSEEIFQSMFTSARARASAARFSE